LTNERHDAGFDPVRILINLAGLALSAAVVALIIATIIHEAT
jgi:hypothetical protein